MEEIIEVLVYGYFTEANLSILIKYSCDSQMSDNRDTQVMQYLTDEVFCRLANQNRGQILFQN